VVPRPTRIDLIRQPRTAKGISGETSLKNRLFVTAHFALQWRRNSLLRAECRAILGRSISNRCLVGKVILYMRIRMFPSVPILERSFPIFIGPVGCSMDGTIVGTGTILLFFLRLACQICGRARHNFPDLFLTLCICLPNSVSNRTLARPGRKLAWAGCTASSGIPLTPVCIELYAQFVGDWSYYFHDHSWQPVPGGDHTARRDCLATLQNTTQSTVNIARMKPGAALLRPVFRSIG